MNGLTDLKQLVSSMQAELQDGLWVFFSTDQSLKDCLKFQPIVTVNELEGLTVVISKDKADEYGVDYDQLFKMISLNVHSSLEAVGLTAVFSKCLTEHGISSNVVAGYFHDHIFVPEALAEKAIDALKQLATEYSK